MYCYCIFSSSTIVVNSWNLIILRFITSSHKVLIIITTMAADFMIENFMWLQEHTSLLPVPRSGGVRFQLHWRYWKIYFRLIIVKYRTGPEDKKKKL